MTDYAQSLNEHYGRSNLKEIILEALRAAGKDLDHLTYNDLSSLDHFHSRGKAATLELAKLANFPAGSRILDVGGGLGGPARTLAAEFGLTVTVLDITEDYCRVGEMLTDM